MRAFISLASCQLSGLLRRSLVAALAVGGLAAPIVSAAAQTSRTQAIADAQKAKAGRLRPEGPSGGERAVIWVMRSPLLGGKAGFYPWISRVYPGTGLGVGAGYQKQLPRGGRLDLLGAGSVGRSSIVRVQARLPELQRGLLAITFDADRTAAKSLRYYGNGPKSVRADSVLYDLKLTEVGAVATLRPASWFHLDGGYKWLMVESGGPSAEPPGVGLDNGLELSYDVAQAGLAIDWRTSPGYSTRGGLYRVTWSRHREKHNRPFSFHSIECEAIQLLPFIREQYVLAFRGQANVTMTGEGNEVPFSLAPTLGGSESLGAFATRRFTDRNLLLLTAEYRWRPSRFLDMALFFDAGKVAPRRRDLGLSNLETDWGIGARFHGPTFTAVRVEVAKGREGWRLIVAASQVF